MKITFCQLAILPLCTWAKDVEVDWKSISTPKGDVLPNFSYVGYNASRSAPPPASRPATTVIPASASDQTDIIQKALESVSAGGGGVVELAKGVHHVAGSASLVIPSKTTLRGVGSVGSTSADTTIIVSGTARTVVSFGDSKVAGATLGASSAITDKYVGIGADKVTVADGSLFKAGQTIFVERKVTQGWVTANGMNDLIRNGKKETWIVLGSEVSQPRKITSVSDNIITLDVPLTDSIDADFGAGIVVVYTAPSQVTQAGLENLAIVLDHSCSGAALLDPACGGFQAFEVQSFATDTWARKLLLKGFNNFVTVQPNSLRTTILEVTFLRDEKTNITNGSPADLMIRGTQVLVLGCSTRGEADASSFTVATNSLTAGPNAVINHEVDHPTQIVEPHARWAHGFLLDNSTVPVSYMNRNILGTGHGWTVNGAVAWNVDSETFLVQSPPLGTNWCIGCRGKENTREKSNGTLIATNETITPQSLYYAQLQARDSA